LGVNETKPTDPKPRPPEKPYPDECCGSGCMRCILDIYEDELSRYEEKLAAWRAEHDR
jgi:hypothetical protein